MKSRSAPRKRSCKASDVTGDTLEAPCRLCPYQRWRDSVNCVRVPVYHNLLSAVYYAVITTRTRCIDRGVLCCSFSNSAPSCPTALVDWHNIVQTAMLASKGWAAGWIGNRCYRCRVLLYGCCSALLLRDRSSSTAPTTWSDNCDEKIGSQ